MSRPRCPDCNSKLEYHRSEFWGGNGSFVREQFYECKKCKGLLQINGDKNE